VRRQIWQRVTRRWGTVTAKQRERRCSSHPCCQPVALADLISHPHQVTRLRTRAALSHAPVTSTAATAAAHTSAADTLSSAQPGQWIRAAGTGPAAPRAAWPETRATQGGHWPFGAAAEDDHAPAPRA
jgi:hypothetical protein